MPSLLSRKSLDFVFFFMSPCHSEWAGGNSIGLRRTPERNGVSHRAPVTITSHDRGVVSL